MEPHADTVMNGGPVPSAVPDPAAGAGPTQPPTTRRVAAPAGVPTAADLAAAHAVVEWEQYDEPDLLGAADSLRVEVASLALPLQLLDVERARAEREALLGQLDDYVLPRLRRLDAPLLAVVGGSTGAGKSTLVNSIARREVTRSGVLRPTTRSPVLVHHPYDSGAFLSRRVLPGLTRVTSEAPEPAQPIDIDAPLVTALRLVPHDGITPGLAIIDAPDIDSVVEANRDLAGQLLAAADLWVFVTTATRYSDNVPWKMLRQAVERGVAVAVVLDRVPPDVMQEVRTHLATLLRDRGLGTSPMFTISETRLEDGFLPAGLVAPLAGWLRRLALDVRSRDVVVRRTLIGVLDSLNKRVAVVAAAAEAQAAAEAELRADVGSCYDAEHDHLRHAVLEGNVLRGEVLARWNEFVATGDVFHTMDPGARTWPERLLARIRPPRVAPAQPLLDALHQGLESVVLARLRSACEAIVASWAERTAGPALIAETSELRELPSSLSERLRRTLREWRTMLTALVQERPDAGRVDVAALGVEGVVAVLGVLAVSPLAGVREAGSPGAVAAGMLAAVYGADSVEPLVAAARADLARRADEVLETERERALGVLDALDIRPGRGDVLLARAAVVEEAR